MAAGPRLETFLEMMTVERGAALATVEAYRRDLDDFAAFLAGRGRTFLDAATEDVAALVDRAVADPRGLDGTVELADEAREHLLRLARDLDATACVHEEPPFGLAYLHVHAEGDEPRDGDTAGPDVRFAAQAPTAGRYLLYLDFQVDGVVHTAEFVLDAGHGSAHDGSATQTPEGGHDEH